MSKPTEDANGEWKTQNGKVLKFLAASFKRRCDYYLYITDDGEYWLREEEHMDDDWDTFGCPIVPSDISWIANAEKHWLFIDLITEAKEHGKVL